MDRSQPSDRMLLPLVATPRDGSDVPIGSAQSRTPDPMQCDAGEAAPRWTRHVPVSVNDTYGDPFIPEQIGNTAFKLEQLSNHAAPIAIFTKAGLDDAVLDTLRSLSRRDKVVVYYSLTGLDEGGISFDERVRMIVALREIFPNTFVFTRPIIRGRNDSPEMLARFADVAAAHTGQLVLGGLHDAKKNKRIETSVEDQLIELCDARGVTTFHKTACAAAWVHGLPCWVHDLGEPRNLEVLVQLGYRFAVQDGVVVLERGTTGDINFIRMITRAEVYIDEILSNYNLLTFPTGQRKLESTSSWLAWSENIDVCLDCNYCIIKQIEYLKKMHVTIGVHPSRLPEIVVGLDHEYDFSSFRLSKLAKDGARPHTYANVRITKPCRVPLYGTPASARSVPEQREVAMDVVGAPTEDRQ